MLAAYVNKADAYSGLVLAHDFRVPYTTPQLRKLIVSDTFFSFCFYRLPLKSSLDSKMKKGGTEEK
jgi:hypothetical protein